MIVALDNLKVIMKLFKNVFFGVTFLDGCAKIRSKNH